MLGFLLGAMTGGAVGMTAMCLFRAAGDADRRTEMKDTLIEKHDTLE